MNLDTLFSMAIASRFPCLFTGFLAALMPLQVRAEGLALSDQDAFATSWQRQQASRRTDGMG